MKNEEIVEGNKLIAEFMCMKNDDGTFYVNIYGGFPEGTLHFINLPINYHWPMNGFDSHKWNSSWDWLMPVVEKIEHLYEDKHTLPRFEINSHHSTFDIKDFECVCGSYSSSPEKVKFNSKIEATWHVVVEFIKWYNDNKK